MKQSVKNGIDNIEKYDCVFSGKRLGLMTNHTGLQKSSLKSAIELFSTEYDLKALYSPERGTCRTQQNRTGVRDYTDEKTGLRLPVYSLHEDRNKPINGIFKDIDVLIYDIQDIGSRYWTYIYTMAYAMESCAKKEKTFVVLDRVNPIANMVEGNILDFRFQSFVGRYALPIRHGLTVGELAGLINKEYHIGANLEVVPVTGWSRCRYFDETDLPWVNPTPNITSVDCAILYTGICLFEGTNVSEGRGTTRPFEVVGAPWIDPFQLADSMNNMELPGVVFRPVYFTPMHSKHKDTPCGGVQVHITDRDSFKPVECGLKLLFSIRNLYGDQFCFLPPTKEGGHPLIDLLAGTDRVRLAGSESDAEELLEKWKKECGSFFKTQEKYKLYA